MNVDKMALQRAKTIAKYTKGAVLDVGCNTMLLRQFVSGKYISVDIEGCPQVLASVEYLPFKSNTFDTVVMMEVIEHVNCPVKAVEECARVSRENVIITTPNPFRIDYLLEWTFRKNDITSQFHLFRFGEKEMTNIIQRYLKLCKCRHIFLEIPTFTRFGSISFNINNRFGSCSIYVCEKRHT